MASSTNSPGNNETTYTLTFLGDIMLGRLIDQLLPTHVHEPSEARIIQSFRQSRSNIPHLQPGNYTYLTPWGNSLPLLQSSDLVLGNLETSLTTHATKWPDKVFNYRSHPDNVRCLVEAGVDYVSLANNHTLDFEREGLLETVRTVKQAGVKFAGAGEDEEEAKKPAVLKLRRKVQDLQENDGRGRSQNEEKTFEIHAYSYSDHPRDWSAVSNFNFLSYDSSSRLNLKHHLLTHDTASTPPSLKIISVHWGPNYSWHPSSQIQNLAHFLIDECEIDIVHGHSSHHIQGVEVYKNKLIIYGCGDFVDDYAVVEGGWRNDLSALWRVTVSESVEGKAAGKGKLKVKKLEVFPNRIRQFQAGLLDKDDEDHGVVVGKFRELCGGFGTKVQKELGGQGQVVVDLERQGE